MGTASDVGGQWPSFMHELTHCRRDLRKAATAANASVVVRQTAWPAVEKVQPRGVATPGAGLNYEEYAEKNDTLKQDVSAGLQTLREASSAIPELEARLRRELEEKASIATRFQRLDSESIEMQSEHSRLQQVLS